MKKALKFIFWGALGLFVFCGALTALGVVLDGDETQPAPTATALEVFAPTLAATETPPVATATLPATDTPVPTPTATPTDVPEETAVTIDPADAEYVSAAYPAMLDFLGAWRNVEAQVNMVSVDPTIIVDGEWQGDTALAMGEATFYAREVIDLEPGPRTESVHEELSQAMEYFIEGMYALADGIDHMDADRINEAGLLIQQGNSHLSVAFDDMETWAADLGLE